MTRSFRQRLRNWLAPLALGGLATVAVGADTPKPAAKANSAAELDQKILDEVRNGSEIMKNLTHISDVIGHRLTGSKSLEQANNYTADVMKKYGLENVHLEPWEIPIGWQRGFVKMKLTEPREMELLACSAGWQPGTKGKVTGPVVVLNARTQAELDKYKGKLKNAIIIQSAPATIGSVTYTSPFGPGRFDAAAANSEATARPPAAQPPAGGQRPAGGGRGGFGGGAFLNVTEFLREEGAAAVLRDSNKPHGLLVTTGGWGRGENASKAPPDGLATLYTAHEHYALLYRLAKDAPEGKAPQVELEVKNTFIPGPITCYNTVGEIVGSEKPDEIVVVGAHLDSWDLGTGTTDNGTGSTVTLEVARTLAKMAKEGNRPKRTIRFVLFSGEEQGLHGSRQYCIRHKDEMSKHSLAVVHDTGTGKVLNLGVLGREEMRKVFSPELTALKAVNFEGLVSGGMSGGTDHASFNSVGVPGMACRQDPDEYHFTHHTQSDTLDKAKHPNLIQGAQVLAVVATRAANFPTLMPRDRADTTTGGRPARPTPPPPVEDKKEEKKEEKKPPQ